VDIDGNLTGPGHARLRDVLNLEDVESAMFGDDDSTHEASVVALRRQRIRDT
jgi:hypothetical protein